MDDNEAQQTIGELFAEFANTRGRKPTENTKNTGNGSDAEKRSAPEGEREGERERLYDATFKKIIAHDPKLEKAVLRPFTTMEHAVLATDAGQCGSPILYSILALILKEYTIDTLELTTLTTALAIGLRLGVIFPIETTNLINEYEHDAFRTVSVTTQQEYIEEIDATIADAHALLRAMPEFIAIQKETTERREAAKRASVRRVEEVFDGVPDDGSEPDFNLF